ncbi:PREDICTED: uncharacterized protein LOC106100397 [Papilio polytes]|uniref:uncharacterized protein LOC106100397 n=1 Tax=Papilio polytes TaxID=76194 RepID=UPI000675CE86|nr:PREDICTED: uncharacterized protein LOC106100397 [Papilio polytes]
MPLKRTPPKTTASTALDVHPLQTHSQSDPDLCATYSTNVITAKATLRPKRKRDRSADHADFEDFKNTIMTVLKDLQTTISEIKEQNVKLQESVDFTAHKYDEILTKMKQIEEDRKVDKTYIRSLEDKIDRLEQQNRACSIEIRNIPKKAGETKQDLTDTLYDICKIIKLPPQDIIVKDIFRVNKKSNTPTVIAELNTVNQKESILKCMKKFNKGNSNNKLNSEQLKIHGPRVPIYISENLSPKTKRLYFLARDYAAQEKYKFCWTSYGKVYLRKEEGSPLKRVNADDDLTELKLQK